MEAIILAAVFTIGFEGMVMFQGDSARHKTSAIVVVAEHHSDPKIVIYGADNKPDEIPLLKGDKVIFDLPAGRAVVRDSFDDHVPTLREHIKNGHIHDDVVDQSTNNDGILAIVSLPKGDLTAITGLRSKVRLEKTTGITIRRSLCMARYVLLMASTDTDVTLIVTNQDEDIRKKPETRTIPKDGRVLVSNASYDQDMIHFTEYKALLNKGGEIGTVTLLEDEPCDGRALPFPTFELQATLATRMSLTLPNGDCGPVDNP